MEFIIDTISDLQSNNHRRKVRVLFNFLGEKENENTEKSIGCGGAELYDIGEAEINEQKGNPNPPCFSPNSI